MELKEYIEFWDKWHITWFEALNKNINTTQKIENWEIPHDLMGNEDKAYKYFPEPYYISNRDKNVDAIFLNINPGGGGEDQHFDSHKLKNNLLYDIYAENKKYSLTMIKYLGEKGMMQEKNKKTGEIKKDKKTGKIKYRLNDTAAWFKSKRLDWAKQLLADKEILKLLDYIDDRNDLLVKGKGKLSISNPDKLIKTIKESDNNLKKINVKEVIENFKESDLNILCTDLIPWHSSKASDIQGYVKKNMKPIFENVLFKLVKIASSIENEKMKNKIIVRGVTFRNIVNSILEEKMKIADIEHYIVFKENEVLDEFNSLLTVFTSNIEIQKEIIETRWYLFTGGSSMELPGLGNKYVIAGNNNLEERKRLRDFIFE